MKSITSLVLSAVLLCALGLSAQAGDIDTPGKTSTSTGTSTTSVDAGGATISEEILLGLLVPLFSLS